MRLNKYELETVLYNFFVNNLPAKLLAKSLADFDVYDREIIYEADTTYFVLMFGGNDEEDDQDFNIFQIEIQLPVNVNPVKYYSVIEELFMKEFLLSSINHTEKYISGSINRPASGQSDGGSFIDMEIKVKKPYDDCEFD